jgi:hypothetical protein
VLERVRSVSEGPILLLKGVEVAARYPDPMLRPFADLDLLVPDPTAAQRALTADGFIALGEQREPSLHHRTPLVRPGLPLPVEVHARPNWPEGFPPPSREELFAAAVPAAVPVDGVLTLAPPEHAVLLAAHAWRHGNLRRVLDLIDVAVLREECDAAAAQALAERWGIERIWRTTVAAVDALFFGGPVPWPMRVWARDLMQVRERTLLEWHLQRWTRSFCALPPRAAVEASLAQVAADLRRAPGRSWRMELASARQTLRDSFVPLAEHERRSRGAAEDASPSGEQLAKQRRDPRKITPSG